jgi:hypothetical protein
MIKLTLFLCAALAMLDECSTPQVVQATDCRGSAQPCGIIYVPSDTHAMTSIPVTVPVSAVP